MPSETPSLPAPLERATVRFEKWRRTRRKGERIPDDLWKLAAKLGGKYGVNKTAAPLRLDYYDLKRRIEVAASSAECGSDVAPAFVELVPSKPAAGGECLVELEHPDGSKMRIHLASAGAPELAALGEVFWRQER